MAYLPGNSNATRSLLKIIMTGVVLCAAGTVQAEDFALSLTDDSAKAQLNLTHPSDELAFGLGYTYHTGSRHIGNADFHAQGRTAIGNIPATVRVGARTMYFRDSPFEGGALAPGGYLRLNIPDVPGLSVSGSLHASPTVLSFGDADGMVNFESTVNYRVIRNAEFFAGYRYVNASLDVAENRDDLRLEEGFLGGLRIVF